MVKILIPTTLIRINRILECIEANARNAGTESIIMLYYNNAGQSIGPWRTLIESCNDDDLVFLSGDDHVPHPDFLKYLESAFLEHFPDGDGLVNGKFEGDNREHLAMLPLSTAKYFKKWFYGGYQSYYVDNELHDVAVARGKYLRVPESETLHKHMSWMPELKDDCYVRAGNNDRHDHDLYDKRKRESADYTNLDAIPWGPSQEQ